MQRKNRWRNIGTCECILQFLAPETIGEHVIPFLVEKSCPVHAEIIDVKLHFDAVYGENSLKNKFETDILKTATALRDTTIDEEGKTILSWKKGFYFKWYFDFDRKLVVDARKYPLDAKNQLQALIANSEYTGKVIIIV